MLKVLIIEDDPVVAHIYRARLEKEEYTVETCVEGQAGFYRIHEFRPDAVLLDLMLPKMNGIDILKKIRAQSQFSRIPVIVFTNAFLPNMIQEALGAGASLVFNKATLTPRQILDSLHNLLGGGTLNVPHPVSPVGPSSSIAAPRAPQTPTSTRLDSLGEPSYHSPAAPRPAGLTAALGSAESPAAPRPAESAAAPQLVELPAAQQSAGAPVAPPPPQGAEPAVSPIVPITVQSQPQAPIQVQAQVRSAETPGLDSNDTVFLEELRKTFIVSSVEIVGTLRKVLQEFTKCSDESARMPFLTELYRKVHGLTGSAGIAGYETIAQMAAALEVLLKELQDKPKNINASTLRTVAHAIDFIANLFKAPESAISGVPAAKILVVDDEILSRRAVTYALEKASLKSVNVEDPNVALQLASEQTYDLIFLDVQMPGMDGFELCTKIRALPNNKVTPIIFVTSLTDFKSRAKSTLSGGTDLIAKPFMFIELTVKALTHVIRSHVARLSKAA